MKNVYSISILIIMSILILIGAIMGYNQNYWGIIPILLGILMTRGFMTLNDSPRQIGVISFLGVKTTNKVEGLTLTFQPFGWKIVSVVVMDARKIDHPFKVDRVTCTDRGVVTGEVSISFSPGNTGEKLRDFDDVGQGDGVIKQLDDIIEAAVQAIAQEQGHDAEFMTSNGNQIGKWLLKKVEGSSDDNDIDDSRRLGIKIHKLQIKLFKEKNVIEAEQRSLSTVAMNKRIELRVEHYKKNGSTITIDEARKQLIEEDMNEDGRLTEIRGGRLVNFNTTGKGGK